MDHVVDALVVVAGAVLLGCTAHAFTRAQRSRHALGPWSVVAAFLAFMVAVVLILYGLSLLFAALSPLVAAARTLFYAALVHGIWACLVVLPMVLLEMPVTALLVLRPVVAYATLLVLEALLGPSVMLAASVPLVLLLLLLTLRIDWSRGRQRLMPLPDDERPLHTVPHIKADDDLPRPGAPYARGVFSRSSTASSVVLASVPFAQRPDLNPPGPVFGPAALGAGVYTVPTLSGWALALTLVEAAVTVISVVGCEPLLLNSMLALFAVLHGVLMLVALGPATTFA